MPSSPSITPFVGTLTVAARGSKLSQIQVQEVLEELQAFHPDLKFDPVWIETMGDIDLKSSLRYFDQSNFFTKEIEDFQLEGKCRLSVHSAKDLPKELEKGLTIGALTKGKDSADVLVLPEGEGLDGLPSGAMIATSSIRREDMVRELRNDLRFVDIRGDVLKRLSMLDEGRIDGLVVAECALLRLGLQHLNRIRLPGIPQENQGRLAILIREDDHEMMDLLRCIDGREGND